MTEFRKNIEFTNVARIVNTIMLSVHMLFLTCFYLLKIYTMVYVNIGSIVVYALSYIVIKKKFIKTFIFILMTELWIHLSCAVVCCGWDFGFQLYCFGMISVIFYTKYLYSDEENINQIPVIVCAISIILYILLRFHSYFIEPFYQTQKPYSLIFYCINSALVFFFISLFLFFYTNNVIRSENSLHEIADYDELTELYNRHRMRDILSKVYNNALDGSKNFCTTIIDIDDFKIVNDTYGHEAGDYVLKTVSSLMQQICNESKGASVGRWGGEEFLVVQEYEREKEQGLLPCINTIKKIHDTVRDYDFAYRDHHILITVTAGIAAHQEDMSISATIRLADERLYKGKLNGKNCVALA